ncbi:hypothetical protein AGLY_011414 [Aphis glycines]|uniref:Uncharacterized protein n=1 Tax=Aphis glycines TaxID=307491 RepID=A0A6G0TDS4_APHGL|nr:hypothetical protein AGLY_011414 [Aphis glycines]
MLQFKILRMVFVEVESKKFPVVNKKIGKNHKKVTKNRNFYEKLFSKKSIFCIVFSFYKRRQNVFGLIKILENSLQSTTFFYLVSFKVQILIKIRQNLEYLQIVISRKNLKYTPEYRNTNITWLRFLGNMYAHKIVRGFELVKQLFVITNYTAMTQRSRSSTHSVNHNQDKRSNAMPNSSNKVDLVKTERNKTHLFIVDKTKIYVINGHKLRNI